MSERPVTPRPPTAPGFDPSRAAERAADPRGWRMGDEVLGALEQVIAGRRDIRKFRPDDVPEDVLTRILEAAHRAPSVGLMQPWRFIVIRSAETRSAVRRLAQRERIRQAERFDERARHFLDQKIEGIVEAPLGVVVCCDHGDPGVEVLGRGTIPETDVHSTACAIQNLWLTARAEGLGLGWVSFYRPQDLRELLGIPERVSPMAYLCLGWPDERPVRPGLEASGWSARTPLEAVVLEERWSEQPEATPIALRRQQPAAGNGRTANGAAGNGRTVDGAPEHERTSDEAARNGRTQHTATETEQTANLETPSALPAPDWQAAVRVRDRADTLVRPQGSLGALDAAVERWATITGAAPPAELRAGIFVAAGDHGHVGRGTSLYPAEVSAQVASAAARGETAIGVLARRGGHLLRVVDIGLREDPTGDVHASRVRAGTADAVDGEAMSRADHDAAVAVGRRVAEELHAAGAAVLVPGEIGIGNTTTAVALASALLGGAEGDLPVGRGAGADAAALGRRRATVDAILRCHADVIAEGDPDAILAAVGGLELSALVGAIERAAELRLPVLLDGFASSVAALGAVRRAPGVVDALLAGHRSAEPAHGAVLEELGLEPLLDLRMRLGEASGALLALPLLASAGAMHSEMATFAEAGVDGPAGRAGATGTGSAAAREPDRPARG